MLHIRLAWEWYRGTTMAKQLVKIEGLALSKKQKRLLQASYRDLIVDDTSGDDQKVVDPLPVAGLAYRDGFWSFPVRRPFHRATGYKLAAANPFSAAWVHDPAGPVIGVELLSGGRAFTFDPWELYAQQLVSSPNLLIEGTLRQGKSFVVKRLLCMMAMRGRYAINVSDSKGEHGVVAEALGGDVFKMGVFGSLIRMNPLEAPEQRVNEANDAFTARVRAARVSVLQQVAGLLNPGARPVNSRELSILEWALSEVVRDSGDQPTIRAIWETIMSPDLTTAQHGYFSREDSYDLADGLRRLVHGDLGGMFDEGSSVRLNPASPYTVIDTFAIGQRGEGALAVTQAVTNAWVHNTISNKHAGRQYFLIREEGWRDMKTVQSLEAHQEQLKLSGEYGVGMVLIVHEGGDFDSVGPEGSKERELAKSLLRGYANRICFLQPDAALQNAVKQGTYTPSEAVAIAGLKRGQFLVKIRHGSYVVDGNLTTTRWEHQTFDTDQQMRGQGVAA